MTFGNIPTKPVPSGMEPVGILLDVFLTVAISQY